MKDTKEALKNFLIGYAKLVEETGYSIPEAEVYDPDGIFQGLLEHNYESYDLVLEDEVVSSVSKD